MINKAEIYVIALLVLLLTAFGLFHYGKFVQAKEDKTEAEAETLKLVQARDLKEAILVKQSALAEQNYHDEHTDNLVYRTAHPVGVSQLCNNTRASDLRTAPSAHGGDESHPTPAQLGSLVHESDQRQPYDRPALLDAFAALLDNQNAVIREYQKVP